MAFQIKDSATHWLIGLSCVTALVFSGCDQAEPVSYQIPKENRTVSLPTTPEASTAPAMPTAPTGKGMQVLPGMQDSVNAAGDIAYTAPDGWEDLPASGIRKANLRVTDANGSAELTVLAFPGDVGGTLANINRWRGQIGLAPASTETLPTLTESYAISKHGALYTRLEGDANSILGALLPFHGYTWFFKLQGTSSTVLAEEANFKAFLDSVVMEDHAH